MSLTPEEREEMVRNLTERKDKHTVVEKEYVREELEKLDDATLKKLFDNLKKAMTRQPSS